MLGSRPIIGWILPALIAATGCGGPAPAGAPGPTTLAVVDSTHHVDSLAREPMVAEHPNGTLFVAGYGQPGPKLWRSADSGRSWQRVAVGTEADGAVGNSDVDLAVGPDGTLYFITMGYDRTRFEGTHIAIGVSHDVGATWAWTRLSTTRFADRPWVEVAPNGTAQAIWNDGSGVSYAVSTDTGRTWREQPKIHPSGGSSHLAVGPAGEIAVRIVPLSASGNKIDRETDLVAVSVDGGATWEKHAAPGKRAWGFPLGNPKDLPRWVEPVAFDSQGVLYYLWSEGTDLWLGWSADRGATWTTARVVHSDVSLYFPYLIARGSGELIASWAAGRGDSLRAQVARIERRDGQAPEIVLAPPLVPQSWGLPELKPGDAPVRDPAGEYFATAFLRGGGVAAVTPIQDPTGRRFGFSFWRLVPR